MILGGCEEKPYPSLPSVFFFPLDGLQVLLVGVSHHIFIPLELLH